MGFFLLGRGREHGDLRLIAEELFEDRQAALDALSRASAASDFAHRDAEVFVVDLDAAVPVLLVAPSPAPVQPEVAAPEPVSEPAEEPQPPGEEVFAQEVAEEPAEEPESAGVWEAPPVDLVEPAIAEAVLADADAETGDLADALKRATGSLEAEGIVAAASVGPAEPAEAFEPAEEAQPTADAGWPWEPVAAPADEPAAEAAPILEEQTAGEPAFEIPAFEEPALDDSGLLVQTDEEFVVPKPVIMGSYGDDATPADEPATIEATTPAEEPDLPVEIPGVTEPASIAEPTLTAQPEEPVDTGTVEEFTAVPAEVIDIPVDFGDERESILADLEAIEVPTAVPSPPPEPAEPAVDIEPQQPEPPSFAGLEPTVADDTDLAALTCDDCVYVNTCPNKEGSEPASCGTFQWKSV